MSFNKECEYCDNTFRAIRNSKRYCSDSCRTMACRLRRAEKQQFEQFKIDSLKNLAEYTARLKQANLENT